MWASEPGPFLCRPQTERFEVAALPAPLQRGAAPAVPAHLDIGRVLCMGMGPMAPTGQSLEIHRPPPPREARLRAARGEFVSGVPAPGSVGLVPQPLDLGRDSQSPHRFLWRRWSRRDLSTEEAGIVRFWDYFSTMIQRAILATYLYQYLKTVQTFDPATPLPLGK